MYREMYREIYNYLVYTTVVVYCPTIIPIYIYLSIYIGYYRRAYWLLCFVFRYFCCLKGSLIKTRACNFLVIYFLIFFLVEVLRIIYFIRFSFEGFQPLKMFLIFYCSAILNTSILNIFNCLLYSFIFI